MKKRLLGFTLIELLVVFSVIAILSSIGIAAFVTNSRTQTLNSEASDVVAVLQLARSRSLSQVKPNQGPCVTQPLDGYRVDVCGLPGSLCSQTNTYELYAVCSSNSSLIESGRLVENVSFDTNETQPISFLFRVLTGGVEGISNTGTITILGYDQKRTITITSTGTIRVTSSKIVAPSPTLAPTATPIPTSTPTLVQITPTPTPRQLRVFVASGTYNGNLGGVTGADLKCQDRADDPDSNPSTQDGLGGVFKGWVSSSTVNAKDRIVDGKYIRMDGQIIANSKSDLLDNSLAEKIDRNELNNQEAAKKIWTGTNSDGTNNNKTCNDWTSPDSNDKGLRGQSDKRNSNWTSDANDPCDKQNHLYCFEQ